MLTHQDRILLAVSGGKDSLALWNVLLEAGYQAVGLHIHLGIGGYSTRSAERTVAFAKQYGAELLEVHLEQELGLGVPSLSRALRRAPCSGCGLNKRYLFNKVALERGFDVLATGHNLDDETATLLGNVLHWQPDALGRQFPILERTHPNLVKKVKPLFSLTERETAIYCFLKDIPYVEEECPNALGAHSLVYKDALNRIETESPGSKQQFLQGFFDRVRPTMQSAQTVILRKCAECSQPTTNEVCSFCRMWQRANSSNTSVAPSNPAQRTTLQSPSKATATASDTGTASNEYPKVRRFSSKFRTEAGCPSKTPFPKK